MKNLLVSLIAIPLLWSCGSPPLYTEPDNSPSAKVRIKNAQVERYFVAVSIVDPEKCSVSAFVGWVNGGREPDSRRVGMLDSEEVKEGVLERRVAAGKPVSFVPLVSARAPIAVIVLATEAMRDLQAGTCSTPTFIPKPGEEYEVVYDPSPGKCAVTLTRLSAAADGKVLREDLAKNGAGSTAPVPGTYQMGRPDLTCKKI